MRLDASSEGSLTTAIASGRRLRTISGRPNEQNGSLFFGDAAFALQADRKGLHVLRFLNRLEANLRDPILIYPNDTCANWILVLRIDCPRHPANRRASQGHDSPLFRFHRNLTHDAVL